MLRLRDKNGKTWELPKSVTFIEVCDDAGRLAAVVHRIADNKITVYSPDDENFTRYVATYHVEPTKVTKL